MAFLVAVCAAALALIHALTVVPRLPEPTEPPLPGDQPKTPYADLLQAGRVVLLVAGCSLAGLAAFWMPPATWPMWAVYAGTFGTLVSVDLLTTWLPIRLHYLAAAELAVAAIVLGIVSGPEPILRGLAGALIAGSAFWLVWRVSGTFGFGDVRLATVVGFVAASVAWQVLMVALVAGTAIGALWGVASMLAARREGRNTAPFPYGPALWLGPIVAIALA